MISVLLVENSPLVRLGVKTLLAETDDIDLVGEAETPEEGFRQFVEFAPDVTILGLRFPDSCSIDDLEKYLRESSDAKILMLADHAGDAEIKRALDRGARGYICKNIAPHALLDAIRRVARGGKYIPDDIADILDEHRGSESLTPAEENVLKMLISGSTNKEIAAHLGVSENTIKTQIQSIFGKLGVDDRTSAATAAIRRGLVRIDI
ncbi:MAG TPA: response regulator transcription factor [Pyrinomonadaceae bacterium]|nr:response regulator transcription factor [Pyrinomonadaceae bacterium]